MSVNYPRGSGKTVSVGEYKCVSASAQNSGQPPVSDFELTPAPDIKAARKNRHLESAEQMTYMDQVRLCLDADGHALPHRPGADLIFALANENAAGKAVGVVRWKMGVKPGLPDVGVFEAALDKDRPGRVFNGLFIEFKRQDGVASDVKPAQRAVHNALSAARYKVVVAYGWRRAWAVTCEYLGWEE